MTAAEVIGRLALDVRDVLPVEAREVRERLTLNQDEMGRLLGTTGRTVRAWETRRDVPAPVALVYRNLLADGAVPPDVRLRPAGTTAGLYRWAAPGGHVYTALELAAGRVLVSRTTPGERGEAMGEVRSLRLARALIMGDLSTRTGG